MNDGLLTKARHAVGSALKSLAAVFPRAFRSWGYLLLPGTNIDYAQRTNEGRGSSIVQACILWMCRTLPEAPIRVQQEQPDGSLETVRRHPLTRLLDRPNPYYSGLLLLMATIADWSLGNAYWIKARSKAGLVVELYWMPAQFMEPVGDEHTLITHYEQRINGKVTRIDREDIVHFRYGLDPQNMRKGLSPLGTLFRELFTDDEAAAFVATLLANLGIPGVVISPKDSKDEITQEEAERIKVGVKQKYSGDKRGEPMVMGGPIDVKVLSFSPEQMTVRELRRIPEERVTAIYGTPAVVVGLGAGLDRSTFANFAEAREAAYESNVIPTLRLFASEIATQLLPDFESKPEQFVVNHDLSGVRVLQEDENKRHERVREDVKAGLLSLNEGRSAIGAVSLAELVAKTPKGEQVILMLPVNVIPTDPAELLMMAAPEPLAALPAAAPKGRQNGHAVDAPVLVP